MGGGGERRAALRGGHNTRPRRSTHHVGWMSSQLRHRLQPSAIMAGKGLVVSLEPMYAGWRGVGGEGEQHGGTLRGMGR